MINFGELITNAKNQSVYRIHTHVNSWDKVLVRASRDKDHPFIRALKFEDENVPDITGLDGKPRFRKGSIVSIVGAVTKAHFELVKEGEEE